MARPLFYITTLLICIGFWLQELLVNYGDYLEGSPIFLKKQYLELFTQNRMALLASELLVPLILLVCFIALLIIKLRPRGIRFAYLLVLFLATEFWMVRAFIFPDRMLRYYQMSDPEFYAKTPQSDPFLWYFIAHVVVLVGLVLVREYSETPKEELIED